MALHSSWWFFSLTFLLLLTCIAGTEDLPETVLCADKQCKEKIAEGVTTQLFSPGGSSKLPFAANERVSIFSKSDEGGQNDILVEIKGRRGFIPGKLVREVRSFRERKNLVKVKAIEVYNISDSSAAEQDQLSQQTPPSTGPLDLVSKSSPTDAPEVLPSTVPIGDVVLTCTFDGTVMHGEMCEGESTEAPPVDASSSFHPQNMPSVATTVAPDYSHVGQLHAATDKAGSTKVHKTGSLLSETVKDAAKDSKEVLNNQGDEAIPHYLNSSNSKVGGGTSGDSVSSRKEKDPHKDISASLKENEQTRSTNEQQTDQHESKSAEHLSSSEQRSEVPDENPDDGDDEENIPGEDDEDDDPEVEVDVEEKEENIPESNIEKSVDDRVPTTTEKAGSSTEQAGRVSIGEEKSSINEEMGGTVKDIPIVGKNASEVAGAQLVEQAQQPKDEPPSTGKRENGTRGAPLEALGIEKPSPGSGTSAAVVVGYSVEHSTSESNHEQLSGSVAGAVSEELSSRGDSVPLPSASTPPATGDSSSLAPAAVEPRLESSASELRQGQLDGSVAGVVSGEPLPGGDSVQISSTVTTSVTTDPSLLAPAVAESNLKPSLPKSGHEQLGGSKTGEASVESLSGSDSVQTPSAVTAGAATDPSLLAPAVAESNLEPSLPKSGHEQLGGSKTGEASVESLSGSDSVQTPSAVTTGAATDPSLLAPAVAEFNLEPSLPKSGHEQLGGSKTGEASVESLSGSDSMQISSAVTAGATTDPSLSAPAAVQSKLESSALQPRPEQLGGPMAGIASDELLPATATFSATTESTSTAGSAVTDGSGGPARDNVASLSVHSPLFDTTEHRTTTQNVSQSAEHEQTSDFYGDSSPLLNPSTVEPSVEQHILGTPSLHSEVSSRVQTSDSSIAMEPSASGLTTVDEDLSVDTAINDPGPSIVEDRKDSSADTAVHDVSPSIIEDSKDDALTMGSPYERRSLFSVSPQQEEILATPPTPLAMRPLSKGNGESLSNTRPSDTAGVLKSVDKIAATSTTEDGDSVAIGVQESSQTASPDDDIEMSPETYKDLPEESFMNYMQLYFNMAKEYTQYTVDLLPDPLHAALQDFAVQGLSPRVAVFTFLSGVFGFVLLISYSCFVNRRKELSLMATVASLEQKLFTVLTERDVLREEVQQAKVQAANTYKNSLEKQDMVRKLQKENKELEKSNVQLEAALHKVKEAWTQDRDQLGLLRSELSQKEVEITEFRDILDRERGEKERVQAELQKCEDLIAEGRTKVEQLKCNEKRLTCDLAELQAAREMLLEEREVWNNRIMELSSKVESDAQEIDKLLASLHDRDAENQVLQDNIKQLTVLQEMYGRTEDDEADSSRSKELETCLNRLMDVGQMRIEYQKVKEQNDLLEEQLSAERRHLEKKRDDLEKLENEMERLKRDSREAQRERTEAVTKLEILSSYFKEREVQLQKEIGLQEALRCQKDGDASTLMQRVALLEQQNSSYKSQLSSLKQEMEVSERNYKNQITDQEKRAHENWLAARAAERKLEEANKELASLRQRLTFVQREKIQQAQSALANNHSAKQSLASSDDLPVEPPPLPSLHPLYLPPPPFMGESFPSRPPEPWMLPGGLPPPPLPDLMFKRHRGSPGPLARASPGSSVRDDSPPRSRGSPPLPRLPHFYDPRGGPSPPFGPLGPPPFLGPHGPPPPLGPPFGPGPGSRGFRGHHRSSNSTSDGASSAHSTKRPSPQPVQNTKNNNSPAMGV